MFEVWQISSLTGKNCDQQLTYWKKKLEGYETLNLVTDYPRPLEIDFKRKSVHFEVDKGLSTSLREVAKSLEVSLHNLLLASYYLMLNSYTRQDDIVIGIPVVNRHYTQIENLIGFFVNTLALRMIIDTTSKITSFIKRIETEVIEAQKHQDLSFEKLVDELQVPKDTSRHPIFQVSFGVQEFGSEGKNISKILDGSYNNDENNIYSVAKFDIETFIDDSSDILRGMFNFRVNLYKEDTVKRFISTYLTILEQIGRVLEDGTANDSQNISDMKYLTKEEEKLQLKAWNATDKPYPHKETIHALFEEQASKNPENIAVTFEDVTLTYKELNKRANKLARYLITHHGIKADTLVALLLDRSEEMIVAILGVLKAGGAYVPLDPEYPDERIRHILDDTSSSVVVVNERNVERLRGIGIKAELVSIDSSELFKVLSIESSSNLTSHNKGITGSNLAYVIYTSGTTGKPKGVMQLHGNVVRLFTSTDDWFKFNNKDVWTLFHSYVFDFTVWEIWGALLYGGTLVIPSYSVTRDFDAFYELCRVNKVTVLTQTPSALYQFIDIASNKIHKDNEDKEDNGKLLDLRYIIFGGEALNFSQLKPWVDWYGYNKPKLINAYGITETTVIVTCKEITEQDSGKSSSIGRVLPDLKAYILNNSLQLLPIGAIGELYVGGAGLARGYLNNPELTNQKFIPNPFQTEEEKKDTTFGPNGRHSRLYKTGDLVRWLPGANLEYLGRADFQIKIRGFRVELGEIESVLSSHPDIKQCVVISKEHKTSSERNNKYIVAYYTSITGGKVEESALLKHISFKLPDYMIPSAFVYLDRLPLTVNGKIDRKALPNPELTGDSYVAPRSELERKICSIFAEVLGLSIGAVGIKDNFFRLGGDSIVSIQLVSRLRQRLGLGYVSVKDVFSHKSVEKLYDNVITKHLESYITNNINTNSELGATSGTAPLLPIQKWFFESKFPVSNHWNQSFMVKVPELDIEILKVSIKALLNYHDAFRLKYTSNHIQYYDESATEETFALKVLDISTLFAEEEISSVLTSWQDGFDLEKGPLYSIGYLSGFKDGSARVFCAMHHLIVDSVSWRILAEDLREFYYKVEKKVEENESLKLLTLGNKGTSYKQWAEIVGNYCHFIKDERGYWNNLFIDIEESNKTLEVLYAPSSTFSSLSLNKELTSKLLKDSSKAYNTEINDILLSALSLSLNKVIGTKVNHITLESHGRHEEIGRNSNLHLDISRTVGWFTAMYPVRLEVIGNNNLGDTIKYTKEVLRQVPNKGMGFGSLFGYQDHLLPRVSFNYLGQLDNSTQDSWSITSEYSGVSVSSANEDRNLININGATTNGEISFSISSKLDSNTLNKLTNEFKESLKKIIEYTTSLPRTYLTISDIGNIVSQSYLDNIQEIKEVEAVYLANSLQQGFIYHFLNQGDIDDAYIVQMIFEYKNRLDLNKLKESWTLAQSKYPSLRLRFKWDEELVQVIDKESKLNFRYIDMSNEYLDTQNQGAEQEFRITQIRNEDRKEKYNLEEGNLFRVYIIKQRDDLYTCILSEHHAIIDGWSGPVLLGYVHDTYVKLSQGKTKAILDTVIDKAYLDAQEYLQRNQRENEDYWKNYISKAEDYLDLSNLVSNKTKGYSLNEYRHILDPQNKTLTIKDKLYEKLKTLCKKEGITLNAILQYTWHKVLKVYASNNNKNVSTVVGTTVAGRNLPIDDVETSVGLYINTLPLIVEHNDTSTANLTVLEAIKKLQDNITEINVRSNMSLSKLQKDGTRLFDTLFIFENYPVHVSKKENEGKNELIIQFKEVVEKLDYPLSINAYESTNAKELVITIKYARELFEENLIKKLLSTVNTVITQIAENETNRQIKEQNLQIVTREEEQLLLTTWNATDKPYPHKETIHALFEEQASKNPENIAVTFEDVTLTYKELNKRANKLARYLITHHGIKADTLVALLLDRSEEMIVAILGVLKAGGAYVPLDPEYPDERIRHILDDTSSSVVVVNERNVERLRGIGIKAELVSIDSSELFKVLSIESSSNLTSHNKGITGSNLAYVIYTSGTTGKPKGVMQLHGNVVRLFTSTDDWFKFNNKDVWTLFHSYVFDFTVWEIWGALLYGGTLVIPSYSVTRDFDAFYELCRVNKVTVLTQTPSALYQFIDIASNKIHKDNEDKEDNGKLLDLRYIIFGGEALNFSQLKPWVDWYGYNKPKLINAYGITETTVIVTCKEITEQDSGKSSSIGRVLPDLKAYILNNSLQLLPIGAIGELYVGGAGLARGYLNNPELTNQKFIPNPFQTEEEKKDTTFGPNGRHSRLYKTGDLVRWLPGANLEYLGRADFQIKIRGFRVELGEIESVLSSHPDIKQCVVISKEHKTSSERNNKYIVAYYTSITGGKVEESALLKHISFKLPDYMIPSAFVYLDRLPLTVNGKIDRKALPNPELTGDSYVAPRSELERKICSIFAEVLGLDIRVVGIRDDFFRLGGNSILAIRLVTMINNSFKSHINVVDIFTHRQAALLINRVIQTKESFQTIVKLNNSNDKPNMFMIHPGCAGCEVYTSLSDKLSDSFSCFGLDSYNIFSRDKIDNLHQLAKYYLTYIDEVMAGAGQTSYHLFGWSLGGQIALEIASILEQKGCIDIKVYLLDTVLQDFYIQSLLDSFVYKELKAQDINRIFREEQMKLGYEESYLNRIISNASVEQKLAAQKISNILQHSEIILFKALLKDERFKTDNFKEAQSSIRNLKYNNVDKVVDQISQLEVIEMSNVDHSNIILEEIFIATRCALFAK